MVRRLDFEGQVFLAVDSTFFLRVTGPFDDLMKAMASPRKMNM